MQVQFAIILTLSIFIFDLVMISLTIATKYLRRMRDVRQKEIDTLIEKHLLSNSPIGVDVPPESLFASYKHLQNTITLPKDLLQPLQDRILSSSIPEHLMRGLHSRSRFRRIESAAGLRYLKRDDIQASLLEALKNEHNSTVALYLGQALSIQHVRPAIPLLVRQIRRSKPHMAIRLQAVLNTYGSMLAPYLLKQLKNPHTYMHRIICSYVSDYPHKEFLHYIREKALSQNKSVQKLALTALLKHFPEQLLHRRFTTSRDRDVMGAVLRAYGKSQTRTNIATILSYTSHEALHEEIVRVLIRMTMHKPSLMIDILDYFRRTKVKQEQLLLARVLNQRIDYFLLQINGPLHDEIVDLIKRLVDVKQTSGILFFLNRNKNSALENTIIMTFTPLAKTDSQLRSQMRQYLDTRLQKILLVTDGDRTTDLPPPHAEKPQRVRLIIILLLILLIPPIITIVWEITEIVHLPWPEIGRLFVVRFNYLFAFYSVFINVVYLIILGISIRGAHIQSLLWQSKDDHMLFTPHLLPSISIIAPAYNEAATIIESVNSLLNQRYPNFELIVVNDGSKDDTLKHLIDYYHLEKRDSIVYSTLKTRPMRGVYTTKHIPNLIVVDKVNGGKADSLNLGLNVASKSYFCGIDADSLLESDALLRAVSTMIDSEREVIAAGGNICPVNGCEVEMGSLDTISIPKKFLPRLQSLEYIRAFMSGRVGWAHMNLLLIISGAFGIFNRKRTIQTGGYLTKSEKFQKDTVGEDMELVVRLTRHMRDLRIPYRVNYAYNANCWTEVPESWKILHRQRDRWHRGLIDIMLFHSSMIANPRYGLLGLIGMPYYFIFEFMGPIIEAQGLFFVALSAMLGLLNLPIALLLFSSTVLLGIFVSVFSIWVNEIDHELYGTGDIFRLLGMAIAENFGIRQYISLWRVGSYFNAMRSNRGWGAQVRKGFVSNAKGRT